jgi:hypothetical protein
MTHGAIWICFPALLAACAASSFTPPTQERREATGANDRRTQVAPEQGIPVCVLDGGRLKLIQAEVDPETGDTLVERQPFASVHPTTSPPYAAAAEWFIHPAPIAFREHYYLPYATPRIIAPDLLEHVGEYAGVPLFAEADAGEPEILYVPVRPGCEFQQYVRRAPR